jgi:hypothetical protein
MQHLRGCLPGRRARHFQELLEVGWLEVSPSGEVSVHDWDDWQSQVPDDPTKSKRQADYRERNRERLAEEQRKRRGDVTTDRNDGITTDRGDVQTETETETETDTETEKKKREKKSLSPMVPSPDFETFWHNYPRKVGKQAALQAWKRHKPILDQCLAALTWQRESEDWQKDGGNFVPHPATWINQHRWEDEPRETTRRGRSEPEGYKGLRDLAESMKREKEMQDGK